MRGGAAASGADSRELARDQNVREGDVAHDVPGPARHALTAGSSKQLERKLNLY